MKFTTFNLVVAYVYCFCALTIAQNSILDIVKKDKDFSIVAKVLERQFKLAPTDPTKFPFTFFAPTDQAIRSSGIGKLKNEEIEAILAYHVLDEVVFSKDFKERVTFYNTLLRTRNFVNLPNGKPQVLGVYKSGNNLRFNDGSFNVNEKPANIIKSDIKAASGVIHKIDKVLNIPRKVSDVLKGNPNFSIILRGLQNGNLLSTIDETPGITLFAPSNESLISLLKTDVDSSISNLLPIFQNHMVLNNVVYSTNITGRSSFNTGLPGGKIDAIRSRTGSVTIQTGPIFAPNLLTENGVVHGINAVILPDKKFYTPSKKTNSTAPAEQSSKVTPLLNLILSVLGMNNGSSRTPSVNEIVSVVISNPDLSDLASSKLQTVIMGTASATTAGSIQTPIMSDLELIVNEISSN
ncbi:Stabilin-2 [Smittium culicis]|uniref:Stabilin-2 n=1 Tax=Smittium culicis TaxID=133412 RepID=A0A1R1YLB5_9FUNG|nr:Stabilin-2 [Smittium culicis]